MTKIAIVLLNWKGIEDTLECLASIAEQEAVPAFQTVVVDNASGDNAPERILAFCADRGLSAECVPYAVARGDLPASRSTPRVLVVAVDDNLGFCRGNNLGARLAFQSGADAVLILNNDTTIAPDTVAQLVAASREKGPHCLLSPQILYADRPGVIWWFGGAFSKMLSPSYCHQGEPRRTDQDGFPTTEWVSGCATLMSRDMFWKMGLYDEKFFIWCEEWDLSLRARQQGVPLHIAPKAIVYHKVGRSLGLVSPLTFFYSMRNMIYLRQRYLPWPMRAAFWILYFPRKLVQAVTRAVQGRGYIYLLAFFDALTDRDGGMWKRQ